MRPQKLVDYYNRYGVDGIMVGRAAIGAPWIFKEMKQFLLTGEVPHIPNKEKMALLRRQINESINRIDEFRGILHIRRHLAATFFTGQPKLRSITSGCTSAHILAASTIGSTSLP